MLAVCQDVVLIKMYHDIVGKMCSWILQHKQVGDTNRQLLGWYFSPFLNIAVTLTPLQSFGTLPVARLVMVMYGAI